MLTTETQPERNRPPREYAVALATMALLVLLGIFVGYPKAVQAVDGPRIFVDINGITRDCSSTSDAVYHLFRSVSNVGSADGIAFVQFLIDKQRAAIVSFLVQAHSSIYPRLDVAYPTCSGQVFETYVFQVNRVTADWSRYGSAVESSEPIALITSG